MRPMMLLLLALALLSASGAGAAQTVIHRCTAPDGTPVFAGQSCASLGDVPAVSPGNPLAPQPPSGPQRCPMDIKALKKRIAIVFRAHNANALAGLMLWRGYGERDAAETVQQLAQLMHWSFLGFASAGGPTPSVQATSTAPPWLAPPRAAKANSAPSVADTLTLKLADPAQPQVTFPVVHRAGCLWLDPDYSAPPIAATRP